MMPIYPATQSPNHLIDSDVAPLILILLIESPRASSFLWENVKLGILTERNTRDVVAER